MKHDDIDNNVNLRIKTLKCCLRHYPSDLLLLNLFQTNNLVIYGRFKSGSILHFLIFFIIISNIDI